MACDTAVEMPAPVTPSEKRPIRSQSPKILSIPPVVSPTIANVALPSYRRILLSTQLQVIKGAAHSIYAAYVLAYGRIVSVLPRRRISGLINSSPSAMIIIPDASAQTKLVEAKRDALSTSLAPSLREIILPAPCPNINPKAWIIAISPNTIPTAPDALVPIRPTK